MKYILVFLILFIPSVCEGVNYHDDANCMFSCGMEDDGNETDLSGEGNDLTETSGDIPQDADEVFGTYSRDFESGETEYLVHGDSLSTDINGANQEISIITFEKVETDLGTNMAMVSKYAVLSNERQYTFFVSAASLGYDRPVLVLSSLGSSASAVDATGLTDVITGAWFGLAAVYNDTDMRIYTNGSLDSNGSNNPRTYSSGIYNGTSSFSLGCYFDSSGNPYRWFDGLLDDTAVFDRELSSAEVSDINTNGLTGAAAPTGAPQVIIIMADGKEKEVEINNYRDWLEYRDRFVRVKEG